MAQVLKVANLRKKMISHVKSTSPKKATHKNYLFFNIIRGVATFQK